MNDPKNVKALETRSGVSWEEWVSFLTSYQEFNHTAMARVVLAKILEVGKSKSPEWWAQGVTVAYEQHIGRRQVGQGSDGNFNVTISRTVPGDMDAALVDWTAKVNHTPD